MRGILAYLKYLKTDARRLNHFPMKPLVSRIKASKSHFKKKLNRN